MVLLLLAQWMRAAQGTCGRVRRPSGLLADRRGVTAVEYGLVLATLTLVVVSVLSSLSIRVSTLLATLPF
jgi:Flp pilus assembly pilin Flp